MERESDIEVTECPILIEDDWRHLQEAETIERSQPLELLSPLSPYHDNQSTITSFEHSPISTPTISIDAPQEHNPDASAKV